MIRKGKEIADLVIWHGLKLKLIFYIGYDCYFSFCENVEVILNYFKTRCFHFIIKIRYYNLVLTLFF